MGKDEGINVEKELWKVLKGVGMGEEERAGFLSAVYCCPSTGWRGLRLIMRESSGASSDLLQRAIREKLRRGDQGEGRH